MQNWRRVDFLGSGTYGNVFLASPVNHPPESTTRVAVKTAEYKYGKNSIVDSLKSEAAILRQLNGHPNIVQCFGEDVMSFRKDNNVTFFSVLLEYASEGSLHDLISRHQNGLSEHHVSCYARMLLRGIAEIHWKGFVHCDIKPGNILVFPAKNPTGKILKIADFGLAKRIGEPDHGYMNRGTKAYSAPESVLHGKNEPCKDIWSLGCVVFEMMTGRRVWCKTKDLDEQIVNDSVDLSDIERFYSRNAVDFLRKCLDKDFRKRLSAEQLLKHPFIVQNSKAVEEEEERFRVLENPFDSSKDWVSKSGLFTEDKDPNVRKNSVALSLPSSKYLDDMVKWVLEDGQEEKEEITRLEFPQKTEFDDKPLYDMVSWVLDDDQEEKEEIRLEFPQKTELDDKHLDDMVNWVLDDGQEEEKDIDLKFPQKTELVQNCVLNHDQGEERLQIPQGTELGFHLVSSSSSLVSRDLKKVDCVLNGEEAQKLQCPQDDEDEECYFTAPSY